uniref:Uncharacterized protein n=1 Tax=Timema shepardi TaxID=629360 RepID=A0A7R9APX9_TIMSH|nr:unnamed protein product [Timema shepardi]
MGIHSTDIRTPISPSSAVGLNTTSALANYATEAGHRDSEIELEEFLYIHETTQGRLVGMPSDFALLLQNNTTKRNPNPVLDHAFNEPQRVRHSALRVCLPPPGRSSRGCGAQSPPSSLSRNGCRSPRTGIGTPEVHLRCSRDVWCSCLHGTPGSGPYYGGYRSPANTNNTRGVENITVKISFVHEKTDISKLMIIPRDLSVLTNLWAKELKRNKKITLKNQALKRVLQAPNNSAKEVECDQMRMTCRPDRVKCMQQGLAEILDYIFQDATFFTKYLRNLQVGNTVKITTSQDKIFMVLLTQRVLNQWDASRPRLARGSRYFRDVSAGIPESTEQGRIPSPVYTSNPPPSPPSKSPSPSSPMASLVLTDSSQLTAKSFKMLPDQIMYTYAEPYDLQKHEAYPNLRGGRVDNHFGKTILNISNQDPSLDLPVIDSLVYCECDVLNHAATEAEQDIATVPKVIFDCEGWSIYSSPMASLVLTDSSQLTSDSQYLDCLVPSCTSMNQEDANKQVEGHQLKTFVPTSSNTPRERELPSQVKILGRVDSGLKGITDVPGQEKQRHLSDGSRVGHAAQRQNGQGLGFKLMNGGEGHMQMIKVPAFLARKSPLLYSIKYPHSPPPTLIYQRDEGDEVVGIEKAEGLPSFRDHTRG